MTTEVPRGRTCCTRCAIVKDFPLPLVPMMSAWGAVGESKGSNPTVSPADSGRADSPSWSRESLHRAAEAGQGLLLEGVELGAGIAPVVTSGQSPTGASGETAGCPRWAPAATPGPAA